MTHIYQFSLRWLNVFQWCRMTFLTKFQKSLFEFFLNVFTHFIEFSDKICVKTLFQPATSCVRDQDVITQPTDAGNRQDPWTDPSLYFSDLPDSPNLHSIQVNVNISVTKSRSLPFYCSSIVAQTTTVLVRDLPNTRCECMVSQRSNTSLVRSRILGAFNAN